MNKIAYAALLGVMIAANAPEALAEGDPARGKTVFNRCTACHTVTQQNRSGPHLAGVVGRKAGAVAGYRYSPALASSAIVWDEQALDDFLAAPAKAVPGTKMAIGVPKAEDRQDVISYLKSIPADAQ